MIVQTFIDDKQMCQPNFIATTLFWEGPFYVMAEYCEKNGKVSLTAVMT